MNKKKRKSKTKRKSTIGQGLLQNRLNATTACQIVREMNPLERKNRMDELSKQGYEYNEHLDVLLQQDKALPYDFILFCFLVRKYYE